MPMLTDAELINLFTYHAPTDGQKQRYAEIREAGLNLARVINRATPESGVADRMAAIRKVREAVATANMAIACNEEFGEGV